MIAVVGIDYKSSPLKVRENFSFTSGRLENIYKKIKNDGIISEAVILSTCNRSEIYAVCDKTAINYLKGFFPESVVTRTEHEAINHCFRVSSGLESMVIGECQISGQVKTAYENAVSYGCSGKILNRLFLESITASKKIKTQTNISSGNLSVASIGIKLLEREMGDLSGKTALVLGSGKMSSIIIQNLSGKNLEAIYVASRNSAEIAFKDRYKYINRVDFIISCTAAPHPVIHRERFAESYTGEKPLFILDLAVPGDIEPNIINIPGVKLFKLDDLQQTASENYEKRLSAIKQAEEIINEDMGKYLLWLKKNTTQLCLT